MFVAVGSIIGSESTEVVGSGKFDGSGELERFDGLGGFRMGAAGGLGESGGVLHLR